MISLLVIASAALAGGDTSDWSGFYAGANLGLHNISTSGVFDGPEFGITPDLEGIGAKGFHPGIQAGFNYQVEQVVFGIEGDIGAGSLDESITTIQDGTETEAFLSEYPIEGELKYLATIRGRIGLNLDAMVQHPVLLFVTGGVAFTDFEMDIASGRDEVGFDDTGPTWGGGLEISISPQVTLRAEYLHIDFDETLKISDVATSGVFDANDGNFVKLKDVDMIRVGFNLKIGPLLAP